MKQIVPDFSAQVKGTVRAHPQNKALPKNWQVADGKTYGGFVTPNLHGTASKGAIFIIKVA